MIDIDNQLYVARRCFERWNREQDTHSPLHLMNVQEYFANYLFDDLNDLQNESNTNIGEYVKAFIKQVDKELEYIQIEEEQRALDRRRELRL